MNNGYDLIQDNKKNINNVTIGIDYGKENDKTVEGWIIDYNTFNLLRIIDPYVKYKNIEDIRWINEYDLYIKFRNGKKYLIDSVNKTYKLLKYKRNDIPDQKSYRMDWRKY